MLMLAEQSGPVTRNPDNLAEFIAFLNLRPTCDEVCHRIVAMWPGRDTVGQAALGILANDGSITWAGRFGYEDKVMEAYGRTTMWDQLPSSLAVLQQRPVVIDARNDILTHFPQLAEDMPNLSFVLAGPLVSNLTSCGVLVASGTDPLRYSQESAAILTDYCLALSLYVFSQLSIFSGESQCITSGGVTKSTPTDFPRRQILVPNVLTDRQLSVLQYLAMGYTNRQIGRLMAFSESTIRQATTAIYAYFGVSRRREAVEAAILRNMVEMTSAETAPAAGVFTEQRRGVNPYDR
jgi:DNA-binding CsgD family transcriptional regulator